jgi:hypothetical protein
MTLILRIIYFVCLIVRVLFNKRDLRLSTLGRYYDGYEKHNAVKGADGQIDVKKYVIIWSIVSVGTALSAFFIDPLFGIILEGGISVVFLAKTGNNKKNEENSREWQNKWLDFIRDHFTREDVVNNPQSLLSYLGSQTILMSSDANNIFYPFWRWVTEPKGDGDAGRLAIKIWELSQLPDGIGAGKRFPA